MITNLEDYSSGSPIHKPTNKTKMPATGEKWRCEKERSVNVRKRRGKNMRSRKSRVGRNEAGFGVKTRGHGPEVVRLLSTKDNDRGRRNLI